MAAMMAMNPTASLPRQSSGWADLKAAYRLLNNDRIKPGDIGAVHRELTRQACAGHKLILCVQDDSDLAAVKIEAEQNLMHTTLAVTPDARLLGVLDQKFVMRGEKHSKQETRKQRADRWKESDLWLEAVTDVGQAPPGCRFVQVCDRGADDLRFFNRCIKQDSGFVVRAKHDRCVNNKSAKLWSYMQSLPIAGQTVARIGTQRNGLGKVTRRGRSATLSVRYATLQLDKPCNHPGEGNDALTLNVVYLQELNPPEGDEPVDWMLLTSEPVTNLQEALLIVEHYRVRWVIEEWHRAVKEGCRLEHSQLTERSALLRLTAVVSVIGVRLIQLRDLAEDPKTADQPQHLQQLVPPLWILIVAALAKLPSAEMTPKQFLQTIARCGGWIGRRSDGRPGWKTIWLGWRDIQKMVEGIELAQSLNLTPPKRCG
jgi:Transposase Tn5 dimerisation domain/Transposase DNA-binding